MAKTRPALGRGLSALIPEAPSPHTRERPTEVDLDRLTPNRFQPRTVMDEPKLDALSRSIQSSGVIQPIIVRRLGSDTFEIVAGERRWRAAQQAGAQDIEARETDLRQFALGLALHLVAVLVGVISRRSHR